MPEYKLGTLRGRYVVQWREGGTRRRYRLFGTHEKESRKEALARLEQFKRESSLKADPTVAELWEAYSKEKTGRRVVDAMKSEWKVMETSFGHIKADKVSTDDCRKHIKQRREAGIKDGTIWTELGHLRTVLNWAKKHDIIRHAPPIERPPKPAPKDRFLTQAECQKLIDAAQTHHIKLAIILLLSTASRITALLELTWDRVDFEQGHINLKVDAEGPRKGRATVPMNAGARAALQHAKTGALSDYVIEWNGQPIKCIKTGFKKACKLAELEGVTPHTLRHTAAVHLAGAGIEMTKISQYLGHSNTSVTEKVYARYAPDHLRQEADILDFTSVRKVTG
ncbi:tyrosine-type recombinase/integrase [Cohaesibacter gelatinilyticus]|uniref:Site-specific recombinase XerD n=1 Tax=Cohaesibacter gelatinilyticus TaxID=372072 RepID=A0A285PJS2_9HYPH|nr:site-specific integrase [Cohaesibacter gelatinilyticus]SNZ21668.1 Site-specific recombinase XerD [Cohaesibacter gelatinilyticus]